MRSDDAGQSAAVAKDLGGARVEGVARDDRETVVDRAAHERVNPLERVLCRQYLDAAHRERRLGRSVDLLPGDQRCFPEAPTRPEDGHGGR
jgi:hypothetical protein